MAPWQECWSSSWMFMAPGWDCWYLSWMPMPQGKTDGLRLECHGSWVRLLVFVFRVRLSSGGEISRFFRVLTLLPDFLSFC
jgi:hypothetical protein